MLTIRCHSLHEYSSKIDLSRMGLEKFGTVTAIRLVAGCSDCNGYIGFMGCVRDIKFAVKIKGEVFLQLCYD